LYVDIDDKRDRRTGAPRPHHYHFAHRFLPKQVHTDPQGIEYILREHGGVALRDVWDAYESRLPPEKEHIDGSGIDVLQPADSDRIYVVRMPEPKFAVEAFMTAAVFVDDPDLGEPVGYYFTLELEQHPWTLAYGTVFGAWLADRTHVNMGGMLAGDDVDGFVSEIKVRMRRPEDFR
jgi:hypothetical protein